jgi:subtilisin-like proprotein convertase family protein
MNRNPFQQTVVLAGLAIGLVVSGASPLLDGPDVEAKKRDRRAGSPGQVVAELAQGFSNSTSITINEGTNGSPAPATPYASEIVVNGFERNVADVEVTLHNFSHVNPQDVGVLLVGPEGQMASLFAGPNTTVAAPGVTLTFDDQAPSEVPKPLVSGTFQPNGGAGGFPAPAPSPQQNGSSLAAFNGTNPNGTWKLFVADFQSLTPNSTGTIAGGWSLRITSANGVPIGAPDRVQAQAGKPVSGTSVLGNDSDPDGDPLTAILASQPKQGTVSLQADGSFTYTAKKKAKGTDSFTYLAQDPGGLNALATVDIQIKKAKKKKGKK